MSSGSHTHRHSHSHDIVRNVSESDVLLLEPGSERESEIITEVAERHITGLDVALAALLAYILQGDSEAELLSRADALPLAGVRNAVMPLLIDGGESGVAVVSTIIERIAAPGFEIPLQDNYVARWANQYSYRLVGGINDTSRQVLRHHISRWAQEGATIDALESRLLPWFGESRARRIAVTEATRSYAEGTFAGYEAAGFGRRPVPENRPPEHPNCRCFVGVAPEASNWVYVWYTSQDELVCPLCRPRHLTVIGQAGTPRFER